VFEVAKISEKTLSTVSSLSGGGGLSIAPFAEAIYAFESLIRVQTRAMEELFQSRPLFIDFKHLRPDILFKLAQTAHLTLELDQCCLKKAVQYFQHLPGRLLVNILPRNFYYMERFQSYVPKDVSVIFEVAESEAINNFGLLKQARTKIGSKGSIAIDDFGKGHAGLDRLLQIEPDMIKLDRSLVADIHKDHAKRAFVSGIISATKLTKALVLAEGIESLGEFEVLRALGVDLVQGFLFHRPQAAEQIQKELADLLDVPLQASRHAGSKNT
jgi:EAL domain-containing protein (putative c-di-GMP-specific phosphodiesterase class I)